VNSKLLTFGGFVLAGLAGCVLLIGNLYLSFSASKFTESAIPMIAQSCAEKKIDTIISANIFPAEQASRLQTMCTRMNDILGAFKSAGRVETNLVPSLSMKGLRLISATKTQALFDKGAAVVYIDMERDREDWEVKSFQITDIKKSNNH
jgi:hypothetical protein